MTVSPLKAINKQRDSNLELYRIIVMLLIILHHYVSNSGLITVLDNGPFTVKAALTMASGAWGKTGINCFVLISGYFMCTSHISAKKFVKLFLEIYFYKVVFYLIFLLTGYKAFSIASFLRLAAGPITSISTNFTGCYLLFYLLIPFINILINSMNQKTHLMLVLVCLLIYTVFGGLDGISAFKLKMNYVTWFTVLYLLAAYIRLYPNVLLESKKLWGWVTFICFLLGSVVVAVCFWVGNKLGISKLTYLFVSDCNKPIALLFGVASFLFFKKIRIPYSKFINAVAATTFGVLCIHTNSPTMRQWLWGTLLKNTQAYESALFPVHAILSVLGIFAVCSILDMLRIHLLETPFFKLWDKVWPGVERRCRRITEKLLPKQKDSE